MVVTSQCSTETIFNYSWKQVMKAFWNRYPNPSSSHVLTEDTVEREVRDGKLYSRRILSKTSHVPKWGERFYKNTPIKIIEDSMLDPEKKILITFTRNIGMKKIMKVDEIVEYSEHSDGRTILKRRAYINSQVFGFSRAIRALGVERFKSNCLKTAHGFNHVLRQMFPNGERLSYPMHSSVENKWESQHSKVEQKQPQHLNIPPTNVDASRLQLLKQAAKCSYLYLKTHLNKIAQILSIKN